MISIRAELRSPLHKSRGIRTKPRGGIEIIFEPAKRSQRPPLRGISFADQDDQNSSASFDHLATNPEDFAKKLGARVLITLRRCCEPG